MRPSDPDPVKLFVAILHSDSALLEKAVEMLEDECGPVDYRSEPMPFTVTDYYQDEMGQPIRRIFLSFRRLVDPARLSEIKLRTNEIENRLAVDDCRKVNLDCGYMDTCKVVLASAKYNGQKIYLSRGIYADPALHYEKGHFTPYPWSFPDFKTGAYEKIFLRIRELYKVGRRCGRE
jgi:hypothetical protein